MDEKARSQILAETKEFFRAEIVDAHLVNAYKKAGKLKSYNINPFLFKYLANFLRGNDNPRTIAEALVYPRILGSSIGTSFGMRIQKLISQLFKGMGSTAPGINIEFIDANIVKY